jgi:DNA invertase Pin-like site-specific DNA recombinase
MPSGKFVAYYRVSTQRQGRSGLGLDAQRSAVRNYLNGGDWTLVSEFTEIESGKINERPELEKALAACRIHGATLVIAKLDRLSRDAHFLIGLSKGGVEFTATDMPNANRLTVGIMALVAQQEREAISARTKAALAVAKARGKKLGCPKNLTNRSFGALSSAKIRIQAARDHANDLAPILRSAEENGCRSARALAEYLNKLGVQTRRGNKWSATQILRLKKHLEGSVTSLSVSTYHP